MRKKEKLASILFILIAACIGMLMTISTASASYVIPDDVDYHVTRTLPGEGQWLAETDKHGYGLPEWEFGDDDAKSLLIIPNQAVPENIKHLYLLMTFDTALWDENNIPAMAVTDPAAGVNLVFHDVSLGSGVAFWHWTINPQPASETLKFPGYYGYDMHNHMLSMEVATKCVPIPGTLVLLGSGLAALAGMRRKK